jgi:myo-inositol-1(or 4)-monophosphatase
LNCISIAIEKNGEIIMAAVFNPHLNELFFAEKGSGASLNEKPIRVSRQIEVEKACLVTGFPYTYLDSKNGPLQIFERFIRKGIPVRRLGSAAIDLCWVACGRFDGFYEHKLEAWDSAAGYLIVEEAGGRLTDFKGNKFSVYQPQVLATNAIIHDKMLDVINDRINF